MKLQINTEEVLLFFVKHRLMVLLSFILLILISVIFSSFSHFSQKKRSLISAQIAIGITYLEEGRNDIALFYFQNAFNQSKGLYGIISGIGIIKSLQKDENFNSKAINIASIIKNYKSPYFIKMLILSSYLEHTSHFNKTSFDGKDFEKFEKFANKKKEPFLENIQNINLNLEVYTQKKA